MSSDRELRYFDRGNPIRNGSRLFFVILAVTISLAAGFYYGRTLPTTLFSHPVETWHLMEDYPVGSEVYPLSADAAREHFRQLGWGDDPAVVVGYETATFKEKELMLCSIRTHRGTGITLAVNPKWIAPLH